MVLLEAIIQEVTIEERLVPVFIDGQLSSVGDGPSTESSNDRNQPGQTLGDRPPQDAIDACAELELNDECSFEGFQGTLVEGTCVEIQSEVACHPGGGPLGGGPPESP